VPKDLPRLEALEAEMLAKVRRDHLTTCAAYVNLMMRQLPEVVKSRVLDAVRNGTGKVELRTRVESNETELVLVPTDGSEPLWLARTPAYFR